LKSPSQSKNQLLEILKMKFVLIAFLLTVLVSSSMSQSDPLRLSRDLKVDSNILEEARSQTDKRPMRFGRDLKGDSNIMEEARAQQKPLRFGRDLEDVSQWGNLLSSPKWKFGRDLKVDSNILEEARAQQTWGQKHLMRSGRDQQTWGQKHLMRSGRDQKKWGQKPLRFGRDLDAGAEISLNNLEERDRDECDTGSFCKSDRDCKGMYSSCHTNGHPGFNNLCCT